MKSCLPILFVSLTTPAVAETTRELHAHEHGVGALNIAVEGETVLMEFRAPGADIVGFEYEAESAEDRAAIDSAVAVLAKPLELFVLPAAAQCSVTQASAALEIEADEDAHDHDDHADEHAHDDHHDHDHDDHAEAEGHDDHEHDHNDHAEAEAHDDHGHDHDDHAEAHDDHEHDHDEHAADEASHSEFHAEYTLNCGDTDALTQIEFAYFETFENALEIEVQIVSASGAQAFDVERDDPTLDLRGIF